MSQLTIPDIISIGDVSTYLSAKYTQAGSLFGERLVKPTPPVQIAIVTDALRWGYDGGAQTTASLRSTANYALWLYGKFYLQALAIIGNNGGGQVIPTRNAVFPFTITSADFEEDGVSYNNSNIVGVGRLMIFIDNWNQWWWRDDMDCFEYTATGIRITLQNFDASTEDYTIVIGRDYRT